MSLRFKFTLYLVAVHLVTAALGVMVALHHRAFLLVVEASLLVSLLTGLWLLRALFRPIELIRAGAELIREGDFATRLREAGQRDLDPLIRVYNRMADTLRQERIRGEEREHLLQRIVSASPSGVLTLGLDGKITMANPAAALLLRRQEGEMLGRTLEELGSPLADQIATLEPEESRLVALQGRRRIRCQALTFMDRGFPRRSVIMDELTEELHRSEKAAYEKLIRMMSHEVGNTASAVRSLLDSCLAYGRQIAPADREDFVKALGIAASRTDRLHQFTQGFAEVVRLPAPRKRPTELRKLLEEIALFFREESSTRRIRWEWDSAGQLPPVPLDPVQMEQVFINIFKNSIEAIGTDGTIAVRLGFDRGRPFVTIRDDGGGIPEPVREHLFEPFYTSKDNGRGIGLTMTKEILLGHGFDFSFETVDARCAEFTILF